MGGKLGEEYPQQHIDWHPAEISRAGLCQRVERLIESKNVDNKLACSGIITVKGKEA